MKHSKDNKPSLEELFVSKKLDQPGDEFWDNFQDQVRSKTLRSVVQEGNYKNSTKIILSFSAFLLVFGLSLFGFLYTHDDKETIVSSTGGGVISVENVQAVSPNEPAQPQLNITDDLNLVVSSNDEILIGVADAEYFVDQSFRVSSLEPMFQHRVLNPNLVNLEDSAVQFSF